MSPFELFSTPDLLGIAAMALTLWLAWVLMDE